MKRMNDETLTVLVEAAGQAARVEAARVDELARMEADAAECGFGDD